MAAACGLGLLSNNSSVSLFEKSLVERSARKSNHPLLDALADQPFCTVELWRMQKPSASVWSLKNRTNVACPIARSLLQPTEITEWALASERRFATSCTSLLRKCKSAVGPLFERSAQTKLNFRIKHRRMTVERSYGVVFESESMYEPPSMIVMKGQMWL